MTLVNQSELIAKLKAGQTVPAAALRCGAEAFAATEKPSDEAKSLKVNLKARTRDAINHWYFGTVYHDFSTAKLPEKVALDDTHGTEIGYARPTLTDYGLELNGVVIRNPDDPQHESNRIAYNLLNGIPQQASIDFTGDYDLAELPDGATAMVNGKQVAGPALVVQNWTLRACAVCKEGADPTTETVATFAAGEQVAAPKNITTLSASQPVDAPAEGEPAKPAEQQGEAAPVAPAVDPKPEGKPETTPDLTAELAAVRAELAAVVARRAELEAEVAQLKARIETLSAGPAPVPVSPQPTATTWAEALAAVYAEHPAWAAWQVHSEAQKRFPELLKKFNQPRS